MAMVDTSLATPCLFLFAGSLILFLVTGVMRRKLEGEGLPTSPERRLRYDQEDIIDYVEAVMRLDVSGVAGGRAMNGLAYYANRILPLDIVFAIAFAAFIGCAALLAAEALAAYPWAARGCVISACFGLVYGLADVGEDIKLRRIFVHAMSVRRGHRNESHSAGVALADAAEVDAANAMTVLKMAAIVASGIGLIAFVIFVFVAWLAARVAAMAGRALAAARRPAAQPDLPLGAG